MDEPTEKSQQRVQKLVDSFTEKSGTHTHPEPETTEAVMLRVSTASRSTGPSAVSLQFLSGKDRGNQAPHLGMPL